VDTLSLSSDRDGDSVTVTAVGDIDLSTAEFLENEIATHAARDAATIVVDLASVTFIDSAGINALLKGRRTADHHDKRFRVTGATGLVRNVLDMTGVWTHLSDQATT
jgi:anti-sigma B factor antagonist